MFSLIAALLAILPATGTTCDSALEVAQTIGCSSLASPWDCYRTVVAQYSEGEAVALLVEAADCEVGSEGCQGARSQCSVDPSGPAFPMLSVGDTLSSCQNDAEQEGLTYGRSCAACWWMIRLYEPGHNPGPWSC